MSLITWLSRLDWTQTRQIEELAAQIARTASAWVVQRVGGQLPHLAQVSDHHFAQGYLRAYATAAVRHDEAVANLVESLRQQVVALATDKTVELASAELSRRASQPQRLAAAA